MYGSPSEAPAGVRPPPVTPSRCVRPARRPGATTGRCAGPDAKDEPRRRLTELAARANAGGPRELAELRQFLDEHPQVEAAVGDLARLAEAAWVGRLAGKDVLAAESVRRQQAALKADILGPAPTALERLLVDVPDRIVVAFVAELRL